MTFEELLIHSCYLGTATTSTNSLGETLNTWAYSTTATDCRVMPIKNEELLTLPGEWKDVRYKIFLPASTTIYSRDRLKYSDEYYLIRNVTLDSSSHHKTILVSRL
jgi:hypothetical protein